MRNVSPQMQYATLAQQTQTSELGMWAFIATEVLFFGALFLLYAVYRTAYPAEFALAGHDSKILLGSINEALLLTSSLTMVGAIRFVRLDDNRSAIRLLVLTAVLGAAFLGVKGYEYFLDYEGRTIPTLHFAFKPGEHGPAELYWLFYFAGTGIHALHLTIGIAYVVFMAVQAKRAVLSPNHTAPIEVIGLYWSFVDTVWLFLFAAIYPLGRAGS